MRRVVVNVAIALLAVPAAAFKPKFHEEVTNEALKFLKAEVRAAINAQNKEEDVARAGIDWYHFNDCAFEGSTKHIRKKYKALVKEFRNSKKALAGTAEFGELLHTVQDFYAHSNWVETGLTDLVDTRLGQWRIMRPWDQFGDTVLVALPLDKGTQVSRNGKVVTAVVGGATLKGIITGAVPLGINIVSSCIGGKANLGHWENMVKEMSDSAYGNGLNKDDPPRKGHAEARALAVKQTRHEWCRLVNLMSEAGDGAKERLLDTWVADKKAAGAACPEEWTKASSSQVEFDLVKSWKPRK
ncbi:MAG: hypothetical protein HYY84_06805 [Deltaproteobacteria bacterium]|nr:hypothetical protein [Deltaproteobacteria bacterium]